jgi:DNA-binding NarL/FixJ family response regulator
VNKKLKIKVEENLFNPSLNENLKKIYLLDIHEKAYITKAEKSIINLIINGRSHVDISNLLNKKVSTIRNQMQIVKNRLHCTSQEQLIFKISNSIFSHMVFN